MAKVKNRKIDSEVLLARYAKQQAEVAVTREALKKELMGCLRRAE